MGKFNMKLQNGIRSEEQAFENGSHADAAKAQQPVVGKSGNRENTKQKKQSFSFRADQNDIERWKLYAETLGVKDLGKLWSSAIEEYINSHALTAEQQKVYEMKKEAVRIQRNLQ